MINDTSQRSVAA